MNVSESLLKAVGSAIGGLIIGWGANSLTLAGRVDAIEKSLVRIESLLYLPLESRGVAIPKEGPKP